jgi:hypothetical protein
VTEQPPFFDIDTAWTLNEIAMLGLQVGMPVEAEQVLLGLKAGFGDVLGVNVSLAIVLSAVGRSDEAKRLLDAVCKAHPKSVMARVVLSAVKRQLGEPDWREVARSALKLDEAHPAANVVQALSSAEERRLGRTYTNGTGATRMSSDDESNYWAEQFRWASAPIPGTAYSATEER